jgi:hypothetical protein
MFIFQRSTRLAVRFAIISVVVLSALPLTGALAGDRSAVVEIEQVDRWEVSNGRQVRGSMMLQLRLREGDKLRPLADAKMVFKPLGDPKGESYTSVTNQQGIVQVDADYSAEDSPRTGVQILSIDHQAVPPDTTFGQDFAFHGDPLPALYVFDQGNSRIQKLTLGGSFLMSWGSEGDGPGEFCLGSYSDFALDSFSNIYVIDGCHRVQKFTSNGDFLMQWGSQGDAPDQFKNPPLGIYVDEADQVYVVSYGRIQRFDSSGAFQMLISTAGQVGKLNDLAIDPDGDLWVSSHNVVFEYSATGVFQGSLYLGAINDNFIIDDDGTFYASGGYRVHKASADGSLSEFWGPINGGAGIGEFHMPESFALAGDHLYVLERGNDRVQILTTDGAYVGTFGTHGSGNGQFDRPADIVMYQ